MDARRAWHHQKLLKAHSDGRKFAGNPHAAAALQKEKVLFYRTAPVCRTRTRQMNVT